MKHTRLTNDELKRVRALLQQIFYGAPGRDWEENKRVLKELRLGQMFEEDLINLMHKLNAMEDCERIGKKYEDLTDSDVEDIAEYHMWHYDDELPRFEED